MDLDKLKEASKLLREIEVLSELRLNWIDDKHILKNSSFAMLPEITYKNIRDIVLFDLKKETEALERKLDEL